MVSKLEDRDWNLLLRRIRDGKCTPFLGAGACFGTLPLGADIARKWAKEYHYPIASSADDLVRVSQFLAVQHDPMFPKEEILAELKLSKSPDFTAVDEPHGVLADMPLPVYMTTNYDDFMVRALKERKKEPKRELCRWNDSLKNKPSVFDSKEGFIPSAEKPVVFHLHGHNEVPESLVLTEDDYLDFLVNISKDEELLPPRIQEALAGTSLLFIGYGLSDWSFRVLFRGLVTSRERSMRRISVSVQLMVASGDELEAIEQSKMQKYLDQYFSDIGIRAYWGTAKEFVAELHQRWKDFNNGSHNSTN